MIKELEDLRKKSTSDLQNVVSKNKLGFGLDMFCGAGGVTEGVEQTGLVKIIAAINHDPLAIKNHAKNHPNATHFMYDITEIDMEAFEEFIGLIDFIWISAECTHFSGARGGLSRNKDSRSLPEEAYRYAAYLQPKYIFVENVREFLTWGPVIPKKNNLGELVYDKKGNVVYGPDRDNKSLYYREWVQTLNKLGWVNYEYKLLNAADYGAPTSRTRYIGIFSKKGLPIKWPVQTHHKDKNNKFGLPEWDPCKNHLNLEDTGKSIFGRKKPLSEKTLKRIAFGINKYFLKDFIAKYYSAGNNVQSLNEPLGTITTKDRFSKIHIEKNQFITQHIWSCNTAQSLDSPLNTIMTKDLKQVITINSQFITKYFSGNHASSIENPLPTITTVDHNALVSLTNDSDVNEVKQIEKRQFIDKYFSGKLNVQSIDKPLGSILTNPHHNLVTVELLDKIIVDIKMRFLTSSELSKCQSFPENYNFSGTEKDKIKFIGNSVPPLLVKAVVQSVFTEYYLTQLKIECLDNNKFVDDLGLIKR